MGEIGVLGSGSDYTAFLHHGVSSIDMGSDPGPTDPICKCEGYDGV